MLVTEQNPTPGTLLLPVQYGTIQDFTKGLIAGVISLDGSIVRCEGNFKSFMESRLQIGTSGLQTILFDLYNEIVTIPESDVAKRNTLIAKFKNFAN